MNHHALSCSLAILKRCQHKDLVTCNIFAVMYLLSCLTVLLVAALVSDVSALSLNNCTARYQAALEEALTLKEQCEGAAFYDCCQVRSNSK